jgi:hypothetical protein
LVADKLEEYNCKGTYFKILIRFANAVNNDTSIIDDMEILPQSYKQKELETFTKLINARNFSTPKLREEIKEFTVNPKEYLVKAIENPAKKIKLEDSQDASTLNGGEESGEENDGEENRGEENGGDKPWESDLEEDHCKELNEAQLQHYFAYKSTCPAEVNELNTLLKIVQKEIKSFFSNEDYSGIADDVFAEHFRKQAEETVMLIMINHTVFKVDD